jgi:hypothetical protein
MTSSQFQQISLELDTGLSRLRHEIAQRGEDNFDPYLFAQGLLLKLRVAFHLIGKQLLEQRETVSDLQYQNEQWMGQIWPKEMNCVETEIL